MEEWKDGKIALKHSWQIASWLTELTTTENDKGRNKSQIKPFIR